MSSVLNGRLIGRFKLLPSQNNNFLNIDIIIEETSNIKKICEKIFGDLNDFEALIKLINKYCCIHENDDLLKDKEIYIFADDIYVYIYQLVYGFGHLGSIPIKELKELALSTCIKLAKVLIQEYDLWDRRYIYRIISQSSDNASKILHKYFGKDGNNQCEMLMYIILNYLPFSTEFKPGFYNVYLTNYNSEDKWFRIAPAQYHTHFNPGHFDPKIKISINSILEKYKNDLGNSKRETISLEDACQNSLLEATEKINIMVNDAKNKLDTMFNEFIDKNTDSIKSERPELEKIRNIAERTGEYYQTVARPAPIIIKKKNPELIWKQIFVIKKSGEITTGIITDVDWDNDKLQIILSSTHRYAQGKLSDMGIKWFLTKGEAEAKLKARTETDKKIRCILTYSTETKFSKFWVGEEIFILSPESNEVLITKISGITGFQNKSMSSGTITYADNNGEPHSIDITEYDTRLFIDLPSAQIAYSEATESPASSLTIIHVD